MQSLMIIILFIVKFALLSPIAMNFFSKSGTSLTFRSGYQEMKIVVSDIGFEWTLNGRLFFNKKPKICKNS